MSKKTIAKILAFVILIAITAACRDNNAALIKGPESPYGPPVIAGKLESKDINESSGIAASKCQPGIFWTHNDSGDDAYIFAVNERGENLGTWHVQNSENKDWEDIAEFRDPSGKCFLYIGEIGDNDLKRSIHAIYRVVEPTVTDIAKGTTMKTALTTDPVEEIRFTYPDGDHNAETLMVHPVTGDIYILTKRFDGPSGIYKIAAAATASDRTAIKIGELAVPNVPNGLLTGGDISPDGKRVVVCDYSAAYELTLPAGSANFDDIWKQTPVTIDRGKLEQGEAVGYTADGISLILTSEKKNSPVIKVTRK